MHRLGLCVPCFSCGACICRGADFCFNPKVTICHLWSEPKGHVFWDGKSVSKLNIENKFFFLSIFTFISTNVDEEKQLKIYQMKSTWLVEFEALLLMNDCCEESYSFPLNFQR